MVVEDLKTPLPPKENDVVAIPETSMVCENHLVMSQFDIYNIYKLIHKDIHVYMDITHVALEICKIKKNIKKNSRLV
jgi:hypothetical protein